MAYPSFGTGAQVDRSARSDLALVGVVAAVVVAVLIATDEPDIDGPNFTYEAELSAEIPKRVTAFDRGSQDSVNCLLVPIVDGQRVMVSGYCPRQITSNWVVDLPD